MENTQDSDEKNGKPGKQGFRQDLQYDGDRFSIFVRGGFREYRKFMGHSAFLKTIGIFVDFSALIDHRHYLMSQIFNCRKQNDLKYNQVCLG